METTTVRYDLPGSAIFRGTTAVNNGQFEMSFFVPKDITYGGALGRISTYFWNEDVDGAGKRDSLIVGGTASEVVDLEGPDINIQFKNVNTGDGAIVGPQPVLMLTLSDSVSGINITGEIGHKIMLTVDNQNDRRRDITEFFFFDEGSYLTGTIEYPMASFIGSSAEGFDAGVGLEPGEHAVTIKAWDNFNNSSQKTIQFTVVSEGEFILDRLLNYPNPFSKETAFTFYISHDAEIKIRIYTISGRLIKTIPDFADAGFNYSYRWDARDDEGDELANGVYLYRISAKSLAAGSSQNAEKIGRFIIMK